MENTWVVLRLKQVMVHLSCVWVWSCAALGHVLGSSALAEPSCFGSVLLRGGEAGRGAADHPACSRAGRSFSSVQAHNHPHPCKLCVGSTRASPKPAPAAHVLPQPGRRGGESVNVPSHNKPLCMGGPET